ncbi:MAG TPA: DegT/DnrJ/EryC1/StrS family aminotransferase [Persephonella sp.]|uniref:Transcriptional regulator n=1 Tax=Persephonella marina (strain DSM 14350 / EX-H1) TaxID=123214 RepID=C0QT43_PERMH|nr:MULTISPECIES: DegT/DnrJ/EryC1/StrS family aminotransferase [Persephonella]ACO03097.1 transcriptional regulator [Persephonella marina EX-H1]HCB70523.1 DegT/DnrJ/EryC1/StrS family aminotransferase [Persephonella sp.]
MIPIIKPVFGKEEEDTVLEIMKSGQITRGRWTLKFKESFSDYIGSTFCHPVCSGTAALYIALKAVGVSSPEDVVIVPAMSFMATIDAVLLAGGKPVVVDVGDDYCMDPEQLEEAVEKYRPKVVIPVHLFGQTADMDRIKEICRENDVIVLEDAAQAHGAEYKGKKAGNLGDLSAFSFYASKNVAMGEGGAILTSDPEIDEKISNWIEFGDHPALNLRITEFQAGIGYWQLQKLDDTNEKRRKIAKLYNREFRDLPALKLPEELDGRKHVFHIYALRHPKRDQILERLIEKGIGARVYYDYTLHQLRNAEHLDCGFSEKVVKEIFAIPVHAALKEDEIAYIVDTVKKVVKDLS